MFMMCNISLSLLDALWNTWTVKGTSTALLSSTVDATRSLHQGKYAHSFFISGANHIAFYRFPFDLLVTLERQVFLFTHHRARH